MHTFIHFVWVDRSTRRNTLQTLRHTNNSFFKLKFMNAHTFIHFVWVDRSTRRNTLQTLRHTNNSFFKLKFFRCAIRKQTQGTQQRQLARRLEDDSWWRRFLRYVYEYVVALLFDLDNTFQQPRKCTAGGDMFNERIQRLCGQSRLRLG